MATQVQPCAASHSASSSRLAVVVANVRTSRTISRPATRRTAATTVALWTSRPAQRGWRTSMAPSSLGAPSAWDPRRGSLAGVLRAGGPAVTQAGVLEGSPVQLYDGLARTKAKADLGAGGAAPLYPGFIPGGSDDLRWATMYGRRSGTSPIPGPCGSSPG